MSDQPTIMIVGGRRGRPRASEPGSPVMAWIKESNHDWLIRLADERSTSVSKLVAEIVDSAKRAIEKRQGAK